MKKFLFLILFTQIFFTSSSYSQSKTNLGLTGGIGFPVAAKDFKDNYNISFNAGFHHEWTVGKKTVLGWEFNLAHFIPVKDEKDPVQTGGVLFFMKFQDNAALKNDIQFFLKGGAGFGIAADGSPGGHPSLPPFALTFITGGGANYMLSGGDKIFAETSYRYYLTGSKSQHYNSVNLNFGYSFCLSK